MVFSKEDKVVINVLRLMRHGVQFINQFPFIEQKLISVIFE